MVGSTVLHYKLLEQVGAGGMGTVFRAEDTRLGRQVAIKFLHATFRADAEQRARFLTEARAASSLKSPNIAAIFDIGEQDGASFIVMEYVEGELVSNRIQIHGGPLAIDEAIAIGIQLADALDEAHSHGVIHRDIKSANLMVDARGVVKVLDFGLAKFVGGHPRSEAERVQTLQATAAGIVLGTVSYMSPEQALGRSVDARSDLFSAGVVLYEMLTGRLPFDGGTITEVVDRILHHAPPALSRFNYDIPQDLEAVVLKALEKEPDFRYQGARELLIDLRNFSRRRAAAGSRETRSDGGPEAVANAVAVMTFSNITGDAADDWIGTGIAETVTADLKNINGLSVIGRARIFDVLKNLTVGDGGQLDERLAIEVGRKLGAAWIVAGGFQRMGEVIRITVQFVDVRTGALVRTVKVDGRIGDIFALQDKIVYELTQGLSLTLRGSEIAEIERAETRSVEAYEAYSRGLMNLRLASRDSLDRAISLFEKAIQHDATYADAWSALGAAYDLKGSFLALPDLVHQGIEKLRRAIALKPQSSQAHGWLGSALNGIGRHDEAIAEIQEALRLEPESSGAHLQLARAYWIGKGMFPEAVRYLERAVAINPESGYAFLQLGLLYTYLGQYDHAEAACRQAIALQEQYLSGKEGLLIVGARSRLGYVYYRQGRYAEAIQEYERELMFLSTSDHALRERTQIELYQKLGAACLRKGDAAGAQRHFELAAKQFEQRVGRGASDPFTNYYAACLFALMGDTSRALKYLEESSAQLPALNGVRAATDPDLESLRGDPRFEVIVE